MLSVTDNLFSQGMENYRRTITSGALLFDRMVRIVLLCCMYFCTTALLSAQIKYTSPDQAWNADVYGNHRAVVIYSGSGVAKVVIEWRRRDKHPEEKNILVVDARTNERIRNVKIENINRETGTVYFEAVSGPGQYYIYYLPYVDEGPRAYYPKGRYIQPENTAEEAWLASIPPHTKTNCQVAEIQSVDAFNSFYPMEVIATARETAALKAQHPGKAFLVFPEDRMQPIRMRDDLPQRWISRGPQTVYAAEAMKGEFFTFQLGVFALQNLTNVQVEFTNLSAGKNHILPRQQLSCLNLSGTTYDAKPFMARVNVDQGKVQALWCTVDIPVQLPAATYQGKAVVRANGYSAEITLRITVTEQVVTQGGLDLPHTMTRLKWLNSTLAQENTLIHPYTPLVVQDSSIALLGRKLILSSNGLPRQIQTFFTPEMTAIASEAHDLFTSPMQLVCLDQNGRDIFWRPEIFEFTTVEDGLVQWQARSSSAHLILDVQGSVEFDGFVQYSLKVTATADQTLEDIFLYLPFQPKSSKYMMGLGRKGGLCPDSLQWTWDVATKNQDGAWIGSVNAGLHFSLRDENYVRPLNTNFYLQKPLVLPTSWGNGQQGGIDLEKNDEVTLMKAYSGRRFLKKGEVLFYNFNLLITPFHPIDPDFQWQARFYHRYGPVDTILKTGAKIVNIHHATPINPYINYPFIEHAKMKAYIEEAHAKGLQVKIYNTIRELSNRAYEIHALRSLGHEIFSPGPGQGFSWLQEHLGDDYIAAWFVPELKDAAIINSGMNRWHNYYVEGMNWLVRNVGIDGIYLDDVAFDRTTMKRIKRVLTQNNHPGILDLHSANQYNKRDGYNNSANLYLEHFPYLNKLWFGEYFDYENNGPEFYLTEVSGIPFGLMGEMLQDGGNPWRGMNYGMTSRMPWSAEADPRKIWQVWDDFGIQGTEMLGYWSERCPVKTDHEQVLVTVYKRPGATLLAVASWAEQDVEVNLLVDWQALGLDVARVTISAPDVPNFQPARIFMATDKIPVAKGKGWLLVVK